MYAIQYILIQTHLVDGLQAVLVVLAGGVHVPVVRVGVHVAEELLAVDALDLVVARWWRGRNAGWCVGFGVWGSISSYLEK